MEKCLRYEKKADIYGRIFPGDIEEDFEKGKSGDMNHKALQGTESSN